MVDIGLRTDSEALATDALVIMLKVEEGKGDEKCPILKTQLYVQKHWAIAIIIELGVYITCSSIGMLMMYRWLHGYRIIPIIQGEGDVQGVHDGLNRTISDEILHGIIHFPNRRAFLLMSGTVACTDFYNDPVISLMLISVLSLVLIPDLSLTLIPVIWLMFNTCPLTHVNPCHFTYNIPSSHSC